MTDFSNPGIQLSTGIRRIIPVTFTFNSNSIPKELKDIPRWTTWSHIERDSGDHQKVPCRITRNTFHPVKWKTEPKNLLPFDQALSHLQDHSEYLHGLSFILPEEGICMIDMDKLQEGDERLDFLDLIDTYVEYSQSGKGVHAFVKASMPKAHKTKLVEIYPHSRACAMTGWLHEKGVAELSDGQQLIDTLCEAYPKGDRDSLSSDEHRGFVLPDQIIEGVRDQTLWSYIWSLLGKKVPHEEISSKVLLANEERCVPPLDNSIVLGQLERAFEANAEQAQADDRFMHKYIFVKKTSSYLDVDTKIGLSKDAVNTTHRITHPGGRGGAPLMTNFLQTSPQFRMADDYIWKPVPFGSEYTNETIQVGATVFANTWEGFSIEPNEGDIQPWLDLLAHIVPNEERRQHVIERFAFDLQFPNKKCNWQLVIHGIEGAGKDSLVKPLSKIFGRASGTVGNNDIKGAFDDGFVKRKLVTVSEVRGVSGDALEELKRKSASEGSEMLCLNPKKEAKVWQENLWSLIFLTNHPDAMKLSITERRFFVMRVNSIWDTDKFDEYHQWADSTGPGALMDYLLKVDLSQFNANKLPERTPEFYDMIDMTYNASEDLMVSWSEMKEHVFAYDFVNVTELRRDLERHDAKSKPQEIKKWLDKYGWSPYPKKIQKKVNGYVKYKSRGYYIKRNSGWLDKQSHEIYEEIDRIEKLLEEAYREGHSKYS